MIKKIIKLRLRNVVEKNKDEGNSQKTLKTIKTNLILSLCHIRLVAKGLVKYIYNLLSL